MDDDVEQAACRHHASRAFNVGTAWLGSPAGVIVDEDYRRRIQIERAMDDSPREQRRLVDRASEHHLVGEEAIIAGEEEDANQLARFMGHFNPKICRQIIAGRDGGAPKRFPAKHMKQHPPKSGEMIEQARGVAEQPRLALPRGGQQRAERAELVDQPLRGRTVGLPFERPQQLGQNGEGFGAIVRRRCAAVPSAIASSCG